MALKWSDKELHAVEGAIEDHPLESGRCAALARRVYEVARPKDPTAHGLQIRPKTPARFVIPKHPYPPRWCSHTLVSTRQHRVDALTGTPDCPDDEYMERHWEYPDALHVERVDVYQIDPGIQVDDG